MVPEQIAGNKEAVVKIKDDKEGEWDNTSVA